MADERAWVEDDGPKDGRKDREVVMKVYAHEDEDVVSSGWIMGLRLRGAVR